MKLGRLGANAQKIIDLEEEFSTLVLDRKHEEVVKIADELLKYRPYYAEVHFCKAENLAFHRKYEEALNTYDLALKYNYRPLGNFYYFKAQTLGGLDRLQEALAAFDLALVHGFDTK